MNKQGQDIILFVDDNSHILEGIQRQLRGKFNIETATGVEEALILIQEKGPFALVVSDMQMPGINGMEFLSRLRFSAPNTIRIMLTGNADMQTAIDSVNDGHLFRFLTKPCAPDKLSQCLEAGLEYYQLRKTEQEFSKHNIEGIVKTLGELLAIINSEAFDRSQRVCEYVKQISWTMGMRDVRILETAAQLSQIGCLVPSSQRSEKLEEPEDVLIDGIPDPTFNSLIDGTVLRHIPSLQEIVKTISYQKKHFDGSGLPNDWRSGSHIPLGARILKVALDYDHLVFNGMQRALAFQELSRREGWYDPVILGTLQRVISRKSKGIYRIQKADPALQHNRGTRGWIPIHATRKFKRITENLDSSEKEYAM